MSFEVESAHRKPVIIVGASARAAAASAIRAGFQPVCADLFGDEDLRRHASVTKLDRYPDDILKFAEQLPRSVLVYVGALENSPDLVDQLSRRHLLLGNHAESLRRVREMTFVAHTLEQAGLPALRVRSLAADLPAKGSWLIKPKQSAAGHRIQFYNPNRLPDWAKPSTAYLQEYCAGNSFSAVFHAVDQQAELIGITRQLLSRNVATPFRYEGSIGPVEVPVQTEEVLKRIGRLVTKCCDLRGLFGVDFLLKEGTPYLCEINPRYTASVEVLEYATGCSLFPSASEGLDADGPLLEKATRVCGKRIVYARQSTVAPNLLSEISSFSQWNLPVVADVPTPGIRIEAGQPICTVFAEGPTVSECGRQLEQRVQSCLQEWEGNMV